MGIRIWEIKKHPPKDASYSELCIRLGHYNPSDMNFKQGTRGSLVSMLRYDSADIGGAIYKIDPAGLDVIDSLILSQNPSDAVVTPENVMLVLNNLGVMKVDLGNFKKSPELFIGGMAVNSMYGVIYSIAYDPIDMLLYLGNPKDFTQNGEVAIFDMSGKEVRRFETGLNPGGLAIVNYR